jgi:Protein of unknown function (DUF1761)
MEVSILPVFLGGLGAWILGALWYSPVLFGKAWQAEVGLSEERMKGNMAIVFGLSLVCMILMSYGLSFVIGAHPADQMNIGHGFFHGCISGFFFAATAVGINYLYQRKSIKLYLIDASYQILMLGVSGAIMAAMR